MSSDCFKSGKNAEIKNLKVVRTKNGRIMLWSKCAVCGTKKSKFIKKQKAIGLINSLWIKTLFKKIPLVGSLFL